MDSKKKAITAAVTGTALGVAGLAVIAMPASAGDKPTLPAISAENLVQSVLTAKTPALDGTIKVRNNLGLPSLNVIPGASALNFDSARVYDDGNGNGKLSVRSGDTEETIVRDGATVWDYSSKTNSATKHTMPADVKAEVDAEVDAGAGKLANPMTAASQALAKIRETSTVSVDGTATVAGRASYELVLTPAPTERTLLREIRVAVDSETRLPLRLEVLTNGTTDPALEIGFDQVEFTQQDAKLFQFVPPKGAKVTDEQHPQLDAATRGEIDKAQQDIKVVGDGWDTVMTGKVPAGLLAGKQDSGKQPIDGQGEGFSPRALLSKLGKPASGAWGAGYVIVTKVGTAVITDDGRFAAGAVPEQVLFEALGAK